MSKINPTIKKTSKFEKDIKLAGGSGMAAAKQGAEAQLRRAVLACLLWEDLAYQTGKNNEENISSLIPQVDGETVAKIAVEARVEQKLRHVPLYIACEMLKYDSHKKYVAEILPKIITRADQLTDFVSLYWKDGLVKRKSGQKKNKPLPSQAKKGLAKAFENFDEYQFAKYDRNAEVKLRDVLRLCHAKPSTQEKAELYKRVNERNLKTPDTWEVALSTGKEAKVDAWTRLINTNKIPALAFLRNLRNMKDANVDHNVIKKGFGQVRSSMLLPLNFLSARDNAKEFSRDIEDLMLRTYAGLPKLPGRTIFVIDCSGSMSSTVSGRSGYTRRDVAKAMAMLAMNMCEEVELYLTAGAYREHKTAKVPYPSKGFDLFDQIEKVAVPLGYGGIFTRQCLDFIKEDRKGLSAPERIIIFSDSQDCDHVNKVPSPFGKNNYIVDVSSHSHGINYKGVWTAEISGWSEQFLTYIAAYEGLNNTFEIDNE